MGVSYRTPRGLPNSAWNPVDGWMADPGINIGSERADTGHAPKMARDEPGEGPKNTQAVRTRIMCSGGFEQTKFSRKRSTVDGGEGDTPRRRF